MFNNQKIKNNNLKKNKNKVFTKYLSIKIVLKINYKNIKND